MEHRYAPKILFNNRHCKMTCFSRYHTYMRIKLLLTPQRSVFSSVTVQMPLLHRVKVIHNSRRDGGRTKGMCSKYVQQTAGPGSKLNMQEEAPLYEHTHIHTHTLCTWRGSTATACWEPYLSWLPLIRPEHAQQMNINTVTQQRHNTIPWNELNDTEGRCKLIKCIQNAVIF